MAINAYTSAFGLRCFCSIRQLTAPGAAGLVTQGGATALGKSAMIGTLDVGKEADFTLLDLASLHRYHRSSPLSAEDAIALAIYRGGPAATVATYARGRCVYRRPAHSSS